MYCAILAFIIAFTVPSWIHSPYYLDLLIITVVHAVLAMTFIMLLRTGMLNLGIASFWGIGAYASTILATKFGMSFYLALPLATIITGVFAFILGIVLIGSGSSGFSFVILSSVIGMLFSVVVGSIDYLGGYNGISNIPAPGAIHFLGIDLVFGPSSKEPYFYLILVLLLIIILVIKAFSSAWIGRAWTAIGLNPRLAESLGVNIFRYKMAVFILASMIAGLIGSFYAHYESFVTPDAYGIWVNINLQVYAILGGIGYAILGPIIGSSVMTVIPEALRNYVEYAPIISGAILILFILFLPQGLLGLFSIRMAPAELTGRISGMGKSVKSLFLRKEELERK